MQNFGGQNALCLPLLDKAIKLSFSISPQILSPVFDSAPVYREANLSVEMFHLVREKLIGKNWIYLKRNTPQTECGPSQKAKGPQIRGG